MTKEEILSSKEGINLCVCEVCKSANQKYYNAMQEYADQQNKELQERVGELESELTIQKKKVELNYNHVVELQSKVEELDLKNKELKTHLTQQIECTEHIKDICDNYESENKQLQAKIDELEKSDESSEAELRQLFKNNSDCYADTRAHETDTCNDVVLAITEDKFIELVTEIFKNR